MGAIVCVVNSAFDIIYIFKIVFVSNQLFYANCGLILLRAIATIIVGQHHSSKNKVKEPQSVEDLTHQGTFKSVHILLYSGFYRVLPSSVFKKVVIHGYILELIL
jgi:hypothetical protein